MSMDYKTFRQEMQKKVKAYLDVIKDIGFAEIEYSTLNHEPVTPEELLETVGRIIDTSKELNQIIHQSPSSIYVADTNANTLRVNRTFEDLTGIRRETVMGRNTATIEEENVFSPSVCSLALKEKRRVIVQQSINGNREFITAGVPILDENGKIFCVITNALLDEKILKMSAYLEEARKQESIVEEPIEMIAVSQQMQEVIRLADLIKNTESTILIEGETGVGKSMMARYIHDTGNRAGKKMTEINCGAIPPALLESELFGYASGAFTGADRKGKPGLIELCEGGTILLDEISELPLLLQVKLLHFLQEKKITRVGSTKEIPVDVRVIAATNKRLEVLVEEGEFREDLYYRLNVVPIVIPPLRERREDILPTAEYYIKRYTKRYNKSLSLDEKLRRFFLRNYWKGNLRELENCVERLVVTEGIMELKEEKPMASGEDGEHRQETYDGEMRRHKTMDAVERDMIIAAYEKYKSSYKVAKALGISQSTAYRKIKKYIKNKSE